MQTQTAGAAGDDGNLALEGEERGEISQDCLGHCELIVDGAIVYGWKMKDGRCSSSSSGPTGILAEARDGVAANQLLRVGLVRRGETVTKGGILVDADRDVIVDVV